MITSSMATSKPQKKKMKRYYEEKDNTNEPEPSKAAPENDKILEDNLENRNETNSNRIEKPRNNKQISGATDPFPGSAPIHKKQLSKYDRPRKTTLDKTYMYRAKQQFKAHEEKVQLAVGLSARHDVLLPEEEGYLEADEGQDTCTISQEDIAEAVDITSGSKHFKLVLNQFGPYRINYSGNGRKLLLAGHRGHVAAIDWQSKNLNSEMNVMETINDVRWLHTHNMYAVAQLRWLHIYDSTGMELHCIKKFNDVLRMEFLRYHFLLATSSATGFLQYLDVSIGKEIVATNVKSGRLGVMCQNPYNAVIHLGHSNGTVTLWSPSMKEPLVKMLCHHGAVRSLSVDKTGMYMASSGLDRKLKIFDIRTFRPLHASVLPLGAGALCHSQKGLLAAGTGNIVQVYKDTHLGPPQVPYLCLSVKGPIHGLQFCPFEDVLGIGHGGGFTSMIVPGAGEANFDALECNPYENKKQQREWEVKALLEKIPPELITLDPTQLGEVDAATMEEKHKEQVERLGFDPHEKTRFVPRRKLKGKSSSTNLLKRKKKVAHERQREQIKMSLEDQKANEHNINDSKAPQSHRTTLDRFKK
ncbi:WD repeat-containing 46 [Pelobates cultripes]|uniref:WD repeat-containing protein 46 n=2 Tax=Pelobates cultripes TaxID=61616 RepID=A0AAD1T288_PELCU|nr:WD repeat-containing 46 [Pelobates cultripes]